MPWMGCGIHLQAAVLGGLEGVVELSAGANVNTESSFCPHRERQEVSANNNLY